MQESSPVQPVDSAHNVEWVVWVGDTDDDGALIVEPEDGNRVRWETVTRRRFDDIDADSFDASLRKLYGTEVEEETCAGDARPQIIAPPMHSFEKHTMYIPTSTKERLLAFYDSWGDDIDRYYQHEASLQVALNHVDEVGQQAVNAEDGEQEERYAIRVEGGTWDELQTAFLETELDYPSLDSAPRRTQYQGLVNTILSHEEQVKELAYALDAAELSQR